MLASPQIKTVKPPYKKRGISDRSSFLHRRTVKFQFVCQKLCFNIPLAELLQKHVGLLDLSAKYQKSLVCLRKDVPYGRIERRLVNDFRGTQREHSSKPLKHSIVERILVFKR